MKPINCRSKIQEQKTDIDQGCVLDWLTSSFTPFPVNPDPKRRYSLKQFAGANRFAASMPDNFQRPASEDLFVYSVTDAARTDIAAALEGVDGWDWDVGGLCAASQQRPLQTLGWTLLHKWGLGEQRRFPAPPPPRAPARPLFASFGTGPPRSPAAESRSDSVCHPNRRSGIESKTAIRYAAVRDAGVSPAASPRSAMLNSPPGPPADPRRKTRGAGLRRGPGFAPAPHGRATSPGQRRMARRSGVSGPASLLRRVPLATRRFRSYRARATPPPPPPP